MSGRLVVEADGGSRGNPGPAAYGALVRDPETGEVLAEVAEAIGVATNNVAEYRGLIAGLQAAKQVDPAAHLQVRLDSRLIVEQMSGNWKIKNVDLKPLALKAHQILPPEQVSYLWVPREQNTHADRLVNQALDGDPAFYTRARPSKPATSSSRAEVTTLLVVRHGRTPDNVVRRFAVGGAGLDDVGREQAKRAADALAGSDAVAVVTSPVLRARQTAELIAERLGVDVTVDQDWREFEFGEWDGHLMEEIAERFADQLSAWRASADAVVPGGESRKRMADRVAQARDRVLEQFSGQTVVVVTHALPIGALVCLALDAPLVASQRMEPAQGSLTEFRTHPDGTTILRRFSQRP